MKNISASCCAISKIYDNTNSLPAVTQVTKSIETKNKVEVLSNQSITFKAGETIVLGNGFNAKQGGNFSAKIDAYCDCSPGGGNITNICSLFSGPIKFISSSNASPGVYVPNVFVRTGANFWYPTSYGYAKNYHAYFWKLTVVDRNGKVVEKNEATSGVDGFTNQSIKWEAKGLSTGTYFITLELINCSGTYTYKGTIDLFDSGNSSNTSNNILANDLAESQRTDQSISGVFKNVSPNPSSGVFSVNFSSKIIQPITIQVLDKLNNVIFLNGNVKDTNSVTVDLSKKPNGVYFLKIISTEDVISLRIVIE